MSSDSTLTLPQPIVAVLERYGVDVNTAKTLQGGSEEIVAILVARQEAVDIWFALREVVADTRLWPVLLGSDGDITAHEYNMQEYQGAITEELIHAAQNLDIAVWLKEEKARLKAAWERFKEEQGPEFAEFYTDEVSDDDQGLHGSWPNDIELSSTFHSPSNPRWYESQTMMYLGFVPTTESWQLPIFLRFDFGNDAPSPMAHAAHALRWQQQYGAEIVCITPNIIEMHVPRPPRDREHALALAREQYDYCNDIVAQGTGTLEVLAALLLDSPRWYFWWD